MNSRLYSHLFYAVLGAVIVAQSSSGWCADVTGSRLNIGSGHILTGTGTSIGGGANNTVLTNGHYAFIGGGTYNVATNYGVVGGGNFNAAGAAWATVGGGAGNIASGWISFIGGGGENFAGAQGAAVCGGLYNMSSGHASFVGAGQGNFASQDYATVLGGAEHRGNGEFATIGGGYAHNVTNEYGFIGGGSYNIAGYYGTIAGGTANLASGTYGVIGGGSVNKVTNTFGFIGGGRSNVVSSYGSVVGGERNLVEGQYGVVAGGVANTNLDTAGAIGGGTYNVSLNYAAVAGGFANLAGTLCSVGGGVSNDCYYGYADVIAGGYGNTAWGFTSFIGSGLRNQNYGQSGVIGGGDNNVVGYTYGTIPGGAQAATDKYGQQAYASGAFANAGDAQASLYVLRRSITGSATNELFLNGSNERILIWPGSTWTFEILVTARSTNGNSAGYKFEGVIENVSGTTAIVGAVVKTVLAEDVAGWDANASADNTNDALRVNVSGDATNIRWVATVRTAEVVQ